MRLMQILALLATMAALALLVSACDSDDDDDNGNGNGAEDPALVGTWLHANMITSWTFEETSYEVATTTETGTFVAGDTGQPDEIQNLMGNTYVSTEANGNGEIEVGDVFENELDPRDTLHIVSETRFGRRYTPDTSDPDIFDEERGMWELDNNQFVATLGHNGEHSVQNGRLEMIPGAPTEVSGLRIDGDNLITPGMVLTADSPSPSSLLEGSPWTGTETEDGQTYLHLEATVTADLLTFDLTISDSSDPNDPVLAGFRELHEWEEVNDVVQIYTISRYSYEIDSNGDDTLSAWNVEGDMGAWTNVTEDQGSYEIYVGAPFGVSDVGMPFESGSDDLVGNSWTNPTLNLDLEFFADGTYVITDVAENVQDLGRWVEDANGRVYWSSVHEFTKQ